MRRLLAASLALRCVACGKLADGDSDGFDADVAPSTGDAMTPDSAARFDTFPDSLHDLGVADAPPDLLEACRRAAVAQCHAFHVCDTSWFSETQGDEATCVAAKLHVCGLPASRPGITLEAYRALLDCGIANAATPDWLCAGWAREAFGWGPSCALSPGPFRDGAPCYSPLQCASLVCRWSDALAACGQCVTPTVVPLGGACTGHSECGGTAWCSHVDGVDGGSVCAPVPAVGDPCPKGEACPYGTSCGRGGRCNPWQPLGASCVDADCALGLDCVGGICTAPPLAKEGEPCLGASCIHGTRCREDDAGRSTCKRIADFKPCVRANDCGDPWTCVDGWCASSVAMCP